MQTMKVVEPDPKIIAVGLIKYFGRDGMGIKTGGIGEEGTRSGTTNDADAIIRSLRHLEVDIKPN